MIILRVIWAFRFQCGKQGDRGCEPDFLTDKPAKVTGQKVRFTPNVIWKVMRALPAIISILSQSKINATVHSSGPLATWGKGYT